MLCLMKFANFKDYRNSTNRPICEFDDCALWDEQGKRCGIKSGMIALAIIAQRAEDISSIAASLKELKTLIGTKNNSEKEK